ncbi:ABC transporter permease [Nitrosomonas sp. HPC101]|uniref:permease-like cell division protein FtsX n=1 Tax=Nitrosomonas sp. HPC101 TaxID=1658667 RepID=UPI00136F597B|nr:permease-like cell division protein FtsX [Nitrosomonas sp. HPC101]MXS86455.1 ABC transporter permease [Nitrosomonas sp. HPC101]
MSSWLSQHGYALMRALRQLAAAPVTSLLSIIVFSIVLSLPAGIFILLENLREISGQATDTQQMTIMLDTVAGQADIELINTQLEKMPAIEGFLFISKEIALQELKQESGMAEVIHNLGQNPLPDAFVINLGHMSANEIEKTQVVAQSWPKVAHVLVDTDWVRKLDAMLEVGRLVVIMLASLFGAALVIVMFNTIRLQMLTGRDEIELSKLIGATDGYIRRPFLYFGTIQGVVGAALAWLLLYLAITKLNEALSELARLYATTLTLNHLSWKDSLILLLFSGTLGWIGARWSVARHLSQIDHESTVS